MRCLINKDFPLRVQYSDKSVVHAAFSTTIKGYTKRIYHPSTREYSEVKVETHDVIHKACAHRSVDTAFLVDSTKEITCKHCQRALGFLDDEVNGEAFVLMRLKTEEFYRQNAKCNWVGDIGLATLYRDKKAAMKQGYVHMYIHKETGEKITEREWYNISRRDYHEKTKLSRNYRAKTEFSSHLYEVRRVKVVLLKD